MWLFRPALFPARGVFLGYPIRSPPATLIDDDPLGRPHTSPKTMAFLSKTASATVNATAGGNYLSPSKLSDGGSVRFALLTDTPLEFHESWGTASDGSSKPFRFDFEPTYEDVIAEMGTYAPREGRGGPGTADVKFCIAIPVFNYEAGAVQVLSISQKSILRELDSISQEEDYANLTEWDFTLSKKGSGLTTEYKLRPAPRKKGSDATITAAWEEVKAAGFSLDRLLTGSNPFKPE
jgi:hypothetical protein